MAKTDKLQTILYEADQILERAMLITGDAPFFMYVGEREYAKLIIDGETATLFWPESESGYYNSCSIECQSVNFPSELLLMSVEEIATWKVKQREQYDAKEKAKAEAAARTREIQKKALELQTLAALKAKYETQS